MPWVFGWSRQKGNLPRTVERERGPKQGMTLTPGNSGAAHGGGTSDDSYTAGEVKRREEVPRPISLSCTPCCFQPHAHNCYCTTACCTHARQCTANACHCLMPPGGKEESQGPRQAPGPRQLVVPSPLLGQEAQAVGPLHAGGLQCLLGFLVVAQQQLVHIVPAQK